MKNHRVIIVDDDADIRDGLQAWLSQDYLVEAFDGAESFLDAINNFDFEDHIASCILLDFQMPNMNGVELQKTLNEVRQKILGLNARSKNALSEIEKAAVAKLAGRGWEADYIAIRQQSDLAPPSNESLQAGEPLVILTAAKLGKTRLIDNLEI